MNLSAGYPEPELGIVVPAYNEAENLPVLFREVADAMNAAGCAFEMLIVDDGSSDETADAIRRLAETDSRISGLVLTRNFGHQAAISIGLSYIRGDAVAIMDADLQDRPADVLRLLKECRAASADVAYAIRANRKENAFKRAAYHTFYRLLGRLARIDIPLDAGDFCIMDRRAVDRLNALPERLRFVRGLRTWIGGKQIGVVVERDVRRAGQPKYTIVKLIRLAVDGLVSFSDVPLRLASILGFTVSGLAAIGILVVLIWRLTGKLPSGAGLATIALSILFLGGVQLLTAGILGEYVGRIFDEVKRRPVALVAEEIACSKAFESAREGSASG
jgi:dolichol-phosphate mannosyltransferase